MVGGRIRAIREIATEGSLGAGAARAGDGLPDPVVVGPPAALGVDGMSNLVTQGILDLVGRKVRDEGRRERDPFLPDVAGPEAPAGAVEPEGPTARLERLVEEGTAKRVHEGVGAGVEGVEGGHGEKRSRRASGIGGPVDSDASRTRASKNPPR